MKPKAIKIKLRNGRSVSAYRVPKHAGYAVSRCGRLFSSWRRPGFGQPYVMSDVWHEIKPGTGRWGHKRVTIKNDDGSQRRAGLSALILETFVGPCPPGMEACHFPDRNPANNAANNLRWDTHKNNLADRIIHGTLLLGDKHHQTKIPDASIPKVLKMLADGVPIKDVATTFGVTFQRIHQIQRKGGR